MKNTSETNYEIVKTKTYKGRWEVQHEVTYIGEEADSSCLLIWDKEANIGCSWDAAYHGDGDYTGPESLLDQIAKDFWGEEVEV